ncbi:hypothetical protein EV421DRAFT_1736437 [Armillaria borealis]|uniref:Uncharacterized protein n=1 Tax=Armillaria borealis TaxID=47425 RepID=A0AA39MQD7_9AGAR|nr:hypothetical protein EV421DRAFT_1736437 [Armillaria borealis]
MSSVFSLWRQGGRTYKHDEDVGFEVYGSPDFMQFSFTQSREPGSSLRRKTQMSKWRSLTCVEVEEVERSVYTRRMGKDSHYHQCRRHFHCFLKFTLRYRKDMVTGGVCLLFRGDNTGPSCRGSSSGGHGGMPTVATELSVPLKYTDVIIQLYFLLNLRLHAFDERRNARIRHQPDDRIHDVGVYKHEQKRTNVVLSSVTRHPYPDIPQPRLVPVSLVETAS